MIHASRNRLIPKPHILFLGVIVLCLLAACKPQTSPTATAQPQAAAPTATVEPPVLAAPTATWPPLAALVNGYPITLGEFQAELTLYQSAQISGTQPATDPTRIVVNDLIHQALLAQAAQELGFSVTDQTVQTRLEQLASQAGGAQALADWIAAQGYSEETFRLALRRSIAATWMRDQIVNGAPTTAEQIHARQILLYNSIEAQQILAQLNNGADFANLAFQYDPISGGELGWFPQGYLLEPEVEAAAFGLQAGQYSQIIETALGFHILLVIERTPDRPLEPGARLVLQQKALSAWLQDRRSRSQIEVFVP